jgi:hypothetical protein
MSIFVQALLATVYRVLFLDFQVLSYITIGYAFVIAFAGPDSFQNAVKGMLVVFMWSPIAFLLVYCMWPHKAHVEQSDGGDANLATARQQRKVEDNCVSRSLSELPSALDVDERGTKVDCANNALPGIPEDKQDTNEGEERMFREFVHVDFVDVLPTVLSEERVNDEDDSACFVSSCLSLESGFSVEV